MNTETAEMKKYNVIAKDYVDLSANNGSSYDLYLAACKVQKFLESLPSKTPMYGSGDKWMTAGDLLEYNKSRIESHSRKAFSNTSKGGR